MSQSQQNSIPTKYKKENEKRENISSINKDQTDVGKRNRVADTDSFNGMNVQGSVSTKDEGDFGEDEVGFFPSSGDPLSSSIDPLTVSASANRYRYRHVCM